MPYVLDASVVLSYFLPDENNAQVDKIFSNLIYDGALVPSLWWYEVRNSFLIAERKERITSAYTEGALSDLSRFPIVIDKVSSRDIVRLARCYDLTVYDAAYLELAIRESCKLATLDKHLRKAAEKENVDLLQE